MLAFLLNNIEQLDLALEHVSKGDANNARFGLMLTDNVVEITLHKLATDKRQALKRESPTIIGQPRYEHQAELDGALSQNFKPKVKFATILGALSAEEGDSLAALHSVRNEVYHVGVRHEEVLPAISRFGFYLACTFLGRYQPPFFSWSSTLQVPERARKYLTGHGIMPGAPADYPAACARLASNTNFKASDLVGALATHMEHLVDQTDAAIHAIANDGPRRMSRDDAVRETQAWDLTFNDEGKKAVREFAQQRSWKPKNYPEMIAGLVRDYPFKIKGDPVAGWRNRAKALETEANPHKALRKYQDFLAQTGDIRALLDESHSQVDQYVEGQIERAQMEKAMRET